MPDCSFFCGFQPLFSSSSSSSGSNTSGIQPLSPSPRRLRRSPRGKGQKSSLFSSSSSSSSGSNTSGIQPLSPSPRRLRRSPRGKGQKSSPVSSLVRSIDAIQLTGERTSPAKNSGGKGQQSPNVSDSFIIK